MGNVYLNIWYHSLFFLRRMEMKREFHSRTKAFACLLTMCAGFFRCLYLYLSGWDFGGRPDGKCGLSIGWFDWPADLRCRSEVSHHAGLYAGNLFDDGLASLD